MAILNWDQIGERRYETGIDHGVLYPQAGGKYPKGVAWNGLTSVSENPSGAEDNAIWADNMKYLNLKSAEEFGLTLGCYMYPDEWKPCNGEAEMAEGISLGQQRRNTFGLSYRTKVGNDTEGEDFGYKLHLVYGCSSSPSEITYNTVNDSPEAGEMSYEISTTPVPVSGTDSDGKPFKPVSIITIDSTKISAESLKKIEEALYGTAETEAYLPLPDELRELLTAG